MQTYSQTQTEQSVLNLFKKNRLLIYAKWTSQMHHGERNQAQKAIYCLNPGI